MMSDGGATRSQTEVCADMNFLQWLINRLRDAKPVVKIIAERCECKEVHIVDADYRAVFAGDVMLFSDEVVHRALVWTASNPQDIVFSTDGGTCRLSCGIMDVVVSITGKEVNGGKLCYCVSLRAESVSAEAA